MTLIIINLPITTAVDPRTLAVISPNLLPQPTKSQTYPYPIKPTQTNHSRRTLKVSCLKEKEEPFTDEMLALELGLEIKKLSSNIVQREEAMKKSKELLFTEFSNHVDLKPYDLKRKWMRMSEDEKWALVKGFVDEWSVDYHPLSARSVKAMVDEYLVEQSSDFENSRSGGFFPYFGKLLGFSRNGEE